jgi:hypothetical protein
MKFTYVLLMSVLMVLLCCNSKNNSETNSIENLSDTIAIGYDSQSVNTEYNSTDSNEDVNDMSSNIKSAEELEVADKKMKAIYKQVMAVLDETEKTELRHEQRKWIKYLLFLVKKKQKI